MSEVKYLKTKRIMPIIKELLDTGSRVRITVTGMSMYPFLRDKKDSVLLVDTYFEEITPGDIILIQRRNNRYVLHRVIKKQKKFLYISGDAQEWREGPIYPEQIIARAEGIWRKDKYIDGSHKLLQAAVLLWRLALPIRGALIHLNGRIRIARHRMKRRRGCI